MIMYDEAIVREDLGINDNQNHRHHIDDT